MSTYFRNRARHKWLFRLFAVGVLVFAVWFFSRVEKPLCDKCNVILVSIDTLSALHLPCYGYGRNTAPNLCSFAEKNILFSNSFSQSPTTLNSHMSIFTSLYPSTHKITQTHREEILNEKYLTLTQVLRNNGYATIYHGDLNDIHLPLNRGIERGFDTIEGDSNVLTWENAYREFVENAGKNKRNFLFLHTYAVHSPYLTGHTIHPFTSLTEYPNIMLTYEEYHRYTPDFFQYIADLVLDGKFYIDGDLARGRQLAQKMKNEKDLSKAIDIFSSFPLEIRTLALNMWQASKIDSSDPQQVEYYRALYDEKILQLDKKLEGLFKLLQNPKVAKNTILIITSDHGEEFMEHGRFYHGANLYQTSTRVPLIIHVPRAKQATIKELVQGIDIYPTVLSLLGLKPESNIEGIDLTGIIKGKKNAVTNKFLLSEFNTLVGLQMDNYRFYTSSRKGSGMQLYNLIEDPLEQENIAVNEPQIVSEFRNLVKINY